MRAFSLPFWAALLFFLPSATLAGSEEHTEPEAGAMSGAGVCGAVRTYEVGGVGVSPPKALDLPAFGVQADIGGVTFSRVHADVPDGATTIALICITDDVVAEVGFDVRVCYGWGCESLKSSFCGPPWEMRPPPSLGEDWLSIRVDVGDAVVNDPVTDCPHGPATKGEVKLKLL